MLDVLYGSMDFLFHAVFREREYKCGAYPTTVLHDKIRKTNFIFVCCTIPVK